MHTPVHVYIQLLPSPFSSSSTAIFQGEREALTTFREENEPVILSRPRPQQEVASVLFLSTTIHQTLRVSPITRFSREALLPFRNKVQLLQLAQHSQSDHQLVHQNLRVHQVHLVNRVWLVNLSH